MRLGYTMMVVWMCMACCAPAAGAPRTTKVDDFRLKDYRGREHALSDYRESKLLVIAFLGAECPLAKLYGGRLATLAEEYETQGVQFLGVNANVQDSLSEIAAYARTHQIEFPILKDAGNKLADALAAVRTPEVFVLDANRILRYRGRIDDQYGIGYVRGEPQENFLKTALDELLAG
jgi:peroxiredoxin